MNLLVTGGAGFIGSHVARFYAKKGHNVKIIDNLSRARLLNKSQDMSNNWNDLKQYKNIKRYAIDIRDYKRLSYQMRGIDTVFHLAAQTGVTSSMNNPREDFDINAFGTFNVLESARRNDVKTLIFASTNKVYGDNVNKLATVMEGKQRWQMVTPRYGIPEEFPIDHCEHSPYGCSKLAGDLYVQDYGSLYGLKAGIFRMSCIYGTHQFGTEAQGWVAWLALATLLNKPITIYGDGKQARDILWVYDLINAYDKFIKSKYKNRVYNIGGGRYNIISLKQLLEVLNQKTGLTNKKISYKPWRPADQQIYFSDISNVSNELDWSPTTTIDDGLTMMIDWMKKNLHIYK